VKCTGDHAYVAVCLTLNLVTEGVSKKEALDKLMALCEAYLKDAIADGGIDTWVPRRAPAKLYAEYALGRFLLFLHLLHRPFMVFSEARLIPQHA